MQQTETRVGDWLLTFTGVSFYPLDRFGLPSKEPAPVIRADEAMLCVEAKALLPINSWWKKWEHCLTGKELPIGITMTPRQAERDFLSLCGELGIK